jgi:uncharacterized protein (TIGR00645 family)
MWQKHLETAEEVLEAVLFATRWLLAPIYLGLALSIVVLLIKFMVELFHLITHAFTSTESEVILGVLALVDLALMGSLLIIVIFSGYENFVSKIDHSKHKDWPEWMGTIDFTGLKLKLLSSIVAISAIQLLKQFMSINKVSEREVFWLVIIHIVFVISSVLLALSDRISAYGHAEPAKADPVPPAPMPAGGEPPKGSSGSGEKRPVTAKPSETPRRAITIQPGPKRTLN